MSQTLIDVGIVLVFVLIGGLFNAAEISMVSLREGQVRHLGQVGGRRGRILEQLVSDPAKFLATVQIGVTFATLLSSAFGAATISDNVADWLEEHGFSHPVATPVALVSITVVLSFVSLVLGELAPKRLALQAAEKIALIAATPVTFLSKLFRPFVWLLSRTSDAVVRLFRGDPNARGEAITEDELQSIVEGHQALSGFERQVIREVFAAGDTKISEVMVPRIRLQVLPGTASVSRGAKLALAHPHSRFPVIGRDTDEIIGLIHIRDLLAPAHPLGRGATVGDLCRPVVSMPGTKSVLEAMQEMRRAGDYLAVVVDEYGGTDGIVTLEDLIEEIVGEMDDGDRGGRPREVPNSPADLEAGLNLDDFLELTGIELPPGPYQTVAGFVIDRLGRLPVVGDVVETNGHLITVSQVQRRRLSRITVLAAPDDSAPAADPTAGP